MGCKKGKKKDYNGQNLCISEYTYKGKSTDNWTDIPKTEESDYIWGREWDCVLIKGDISSIFLVWGFSLFSFLSFLLFFSLFLFFFFSAVCSSLVWDFSSQNRDWTWALVMKAQIPATRPPENSPFEAFRLRIYPALLSKLKINKIFNNFIHDLKIEAEAGLCSEPEMTFSLVSGNKSLCLPPFLSFYFSSSSFSLFASRVCYAESLLTPSPLNLISSPSKHLWH